jgi:hypothetical protein
MKWTIVALSLLVLPALALAQTAVPLDSLEQLAAAAFQSLSLPGAARWVVLSLVAVVAAVSIVRNLAKGKKGAAWVWIASDEGGTVLKWVASVLVAVIAQALAGGGAGVTGRTVFAALGLGALASLRTDWRRLLRALAPLFGLIYPPLGSLARTLGGGALPAQTGAAQLPPASP